jgi:dihydrofolate reductase/thymidylate synthase
MCLGIVNSQIGVNFFTYGQHVLVFAPDLVPGDFIHVLGDAHVYKNHVEPLQAQLKNTPKPFPVLQIKSRHSNIDLFTANDFELIGYQPHKRITMKMAV